MHDAQSLLEPAAEAVGRLRRRGYGLDHEALDKLAAAGPAPSASVTRSAESSTTSPGSCPRLAAAGPMNWSTRQGS